MLAAAGTALTLAGLAQAQQLVDVAGSSLLGSFVRGQASTNDYIGISQQTPPAGYDLIINGLYSVNYRVSGSINGLDELINFGAPNFTSTLDTRDPANSSLYPLNSLALTDQWFNRTQFITSGIPSIPNGYTGATGFSGSTGFGGTPGGNTGGQPFVATSYANRAQTGSGGGITIDVAYIDVPAIWGIKSGLGPSGNPSEKPNVAGYGQNTKLSLGLDGSASGSSSGGGLSNALSTLGSRNLADFPGRNLGTTPADANTVFEYPLTMAPVAPIANPGTGIQHMKMSEMRWLFATGRAKTGENFVVCTRDIGSGTRNAFNNYTGLDPSYGAGDNVGLQSTSSSQDQLGPTFYPTNKGATSGMLRTLRYHRLAIGYAGAETSVSGASPSSWLSGGALDIIDTFNDVYYSPTELALLFPGGPAASDYKRPTLNNILNNTRAGWVINGQAHICTLGDPKAEANTFRTASIPNSGGRASGNTAMANPYAARYVNNILRSVDDFTTTTLAASPALLSGTPAEALATNFVLVRAVENYVSPSNPDPLSRTPNPSFDPGVETWTQGFNTVFTSPAVATPNTGAIAGLSPRRFALTTGSYSDGRGGPGLGNYITQGTTGTNGNPVGYESSTDNASRPVMGRNKIAFDFNGDGVRSLADATDMIAAWRQRNGGAGGNHANDGPAWIAPTGSAGAGQDAVIEILGDANGDGSFDAADIRYWADGLATNASGNLDRKAGFTAVDNAYFAATGSNNFFGTTKAGGTCAAPYAAGDSRADIAGASGKVAPGWAPVGSDGVIDGHDIDYVYKQMRAVGITNPWSSGQAADWATLSQAINFDLSADINGDMKVDKNDVKEILSILGTHMGDVNLDGVVNAADRAIIIANMGMTNVGWAGGDLDGDGVVTMADLALACPADFNGDGVVQVADIFDYLNAWFAGSCHADFNGGGLSVQDIFDFLNSWFAGC
jgi:hypothetical protein